MKKTSSRITALILLLTVISCTALTSCSLSRRISEMSAHLNGFTEEGTEDTAIGESINQVVEQTVINNDVSIEGTNGDIAYATASGLRSAVSIYCTFTTVSGGNSYWNPMPSTQQYYSTGSGVIYDLENDGSAFIITNFHVVYDANSTTQNHVSDTIFVYLYGMEAETYAIPATYVGGSSNYDIAVLHVDKSPVLVSALASGSVSAVKVADSDKVAPGQTTIAIGNPSATDLSGISVTTGIVSVDSEYITMSASDNSGSTSFRVIRTDTPINAGNSGGGLFNDKGELIGIVNAKISSSTIENIGYAIPSNVARAIADNIIHYCYGTDCECVMRGMLGIAVVTTGYSTEYDTESGMLVRREEVTVDSVSAGGLGETILRKGDIIKSIKLGDRTVEVTRQHHLIDAMLDVRVGNKVEITVIRDGSETVVSTTITENCLTEY